MARTSLTLRQIRGKPRDVVTKLTELDQAMDAVAGDGTAASIAEYLTSSGAAAPAVLLSDCDVTGTRTYTLAAGTKVGQFKSFRVRVAASTPNFTVTGTFTLNNVAKTSVFHTGGAAAVGDGMDLIWNGTAWVIHALFGTMSTS